MNRTGQGTGRRLNQSDWPVWFGFKDIDSNIMKMFKAGDFFIIISKSKCIKRNYILYKSQVASVIIKIIPKKNITTNGFRTVISMLRSANIRSISFFRIRSNFLRTCIING